MSINKHKKPYSNVAISRCGNNLEKSVRDILDMLGGIRRFVKQGDKVFIKPNLTACMPSSTGGTTDVLFIEAVVAAVKDAEPSRIIVGECSGNETCTMKGLIELGYADMCARQGVELADLDDTEYVCCKLDEPLYREVVRLPRIVLDSDVFISVPVMKTHVASGITVAIKNSFGLIPDADKLQAHRDNAIEEIITDIARVLPADLVIVDGRLGSEGIAGGSDFTHPIEHDIIYAADDPVAADAVSVRLMKQNPRVRYIQWSSDHGVGNDNMDYITIHGLSVDEASKKFMSPMEQIEANSGGKVRIYELSPCTKCRSVGEGGVSRFTNNANTLLEPLDIVIGPGEWEMPGEVNPRTILLGNCIREEYRDKGIWIGGCPATGAEYEKALASEGVICTKCVRLAEKLVEGYTNERLKYIRILAGGKTIFTGIDNKAMMDDYLLAIGTCLKRYVRTHKHRTYKKLGYDTDEYVILIEGCPPDETGVRYALDELLERAVKKDQ